MGEAPLRILRGADADKFVWATGLEDTFIPQSRPGQRPIDEYELIGHYDAWREDIDLAATIGFDAIRYGIPWYRIQPARGRFDWEWTDRVIGHLAERGLEPTLDLVHYGTPLWLLDGFLDPDYPAIVAEYAGAVARRYAGAVRCYTPVNEPHVTALICGRAGQWPPYGRDDAGYVAVARAVCRGVIETARAVRAEAPGAVIVHVEGTGYWIDDRVPTPPVSDDERCLATLELLTGRLTDDHPLRPELSAAGLTDADLDWFAVHRLGIDVLGLNYYPDGSVHRRIAGPPELVPHWGGTDYLGRAVRELHARYGVPIFISETGCNELSSGRFDGPWLPPPEGSGTDAAAGADPSAFRRWWLEQLVTEISAIRSEGLPLVGCTWWPLIDAVSWAYFAGQGPVDGYIEPGGLHALRRGADGGLGREALPIADRLREVIAEGLVA